MLSSVLRGARFCDLSIQQILLTLPKDEPLWLEAEPTNPYDHNAIKVWANVPEGVAADVPDLDERGEPQVREHDDHTQVFIGYIAKEHCYAVKMLGPVETLAAKIWEINGAMPELVVGLPHELGLVPAE